MPSTRPCAAFEPLPPDFDVKALVESTPNFEFVVRIHADMIDHHGVENFERLVIQHVIIGGKPLVIEGYETRLDRWIFALQWLRDNVGAKVENARDLSKQVNVPMSIGHYLKHMALLTNQWTSHNYKDPDRQRMYLKDIDCPDMWHERLREHIPPVLFYLNETSGNPGGLGAIDEPDLANVADVRRGRGIAKAGDLMSSLPKGMRAENLMCYIGHEGTYTPAHKEMCASLGQNIMVEASTGLPEDGQPTKPGSSIWFMTESREREVVSEYWLSRLGHDIEVEKHFAQVNAWRNAPFMTYVVEQRPGDFILIPPLAPHQVWNRGTRTMKVAWNRTTVETLEMAMGEALPKARMVCRDEQYKNKAIVFYTLQKYSKLLKNAEKLKLRGPAPKKLDKATMKIKQLEKDFKRLHVLYTQILVSESFYTDRTERRVEMLPFDSNITCSYCRCNIFNRFLTCQACVRPSRDGDQDTYDICLECYAMGRSCACISKLKWCEQWDWGDLVQKHELWRRQIIQLEDQVTEKSPKSLRHELDKLGRARTLAQICQTELLKRPFRDINKPETPPVATEDDLEDEPQVDENGKVKKKKIKKKSEKFMRDHARCHVDMYREPKWKQAQCTKCQKNYCYGVLFRAYDEMPQDVMRNPDWICPSCRNICGCRYCRNKPDYTKYTPRGTMLGHNTKLVADDRSTESLVDFSFSNLGWIQKAGDDTDGSNSRRMQERRREAEAAKDRGDQLGDNYVNDVNTADIDADVHSGLLRLAEQEGIPIDPSLGVDVTQPLDDSNDEAEVHEHPEELEPSRNGIATDEAVYALPENGMMQDIQHAYDVTDAITFVYPDPAVAPPPPPPVPEQGYQEASTSLATEEVDSPTGIAMVSRKRKRPAKTDDGDRPFQVKPSGQSYKQKNNNNKKRPSRVVKLTINREKLQDVQRMATLAQTALTVQPSAPVLGSDLRALNVSYPVVEGQPLLAKKARADKSPVEEVDTEYAPGRYRDRRKHVTHGMPLPSPDADIGRRTTRMHNIRYEEPDEEEFDEMVQPKLSSKLDTMTEAAGVVETVETYDIDDVDDTDSDSNVKDRARQIPPPAGKRPRLSVPKSTLAIINGTEHDSTARAADSTQLRSETPKLETHAAAAASRSKLEAQAQANRRAKMAAVDMVENETDALDDDWSVDNDVAQLEAASIPDRGINLQDSEPATSATDKDTDVQAAAVKKRHSMPSAGVQLGRGTPVSHNFSPVATQPKPAAKTVSTQKASANAWADSDSEDETSGFYIASNGVGNHIPAIRVIGNHIKPDSGRRGRSRGRRARRAFY